MTVRKFFLRELLHIGFRRALLMLSTTVLGGVILLLTGVLGAPVYESTARVAPGAGVAPQAPPSQGFHHARPDAALITSETVLREACAGQAGLKPTTLRRALRVRPLADGGFDISCRLSSPDRARQALSRLLAVYSGPAGAVEGDKAALSLLEERADLARREWEAAQAAVAAYEEEYGTIALADRRNRMLQENPPQSEGVSTTYTTEVRSKLDAIDRALEGLSRLQLDAEVKARVVVAQMERIDTLRTSLALREAGLAGVHVVSGPTSPSGPVRPRHGLRFLVGLAGGLALGVFLAAFLELLSHGLKTPEDVEHYLGVHLLASFFRPIQGKSHQQAEAESLCTVLEVLNADAPAQVVQVTSARPHERAGEVAEALSAAYGQDPAFQVLLMDLTSNEGSAGKTGFTDLLLDSGKVLPADVGGVTRIGRGAGELPPPFAWTSPKLDVVMSRLRERYQRIVVHAGPLLTAPEALQFARLADGVVVAVRAEHTRREVVLRTLHMLKQSGGHVLGVVLTDRLRRIPNIIYNRL